jgi:DNA-binding transcriptional MerR regulator
MKDLLRQVPVSRQTVHYYLRRGLLPPAVSAKRTYALYAAETAPLLLLIRECQRRRWTLQEIGNLFRKHHFDPLRIREGLKGRERDGAPEAEPRPAKETGVDFSPGWREDLRKTGLLARETGQLSVDAARLTAAAWHLAKQGVPLEELKALTAEADRAAQAELDVFARALPAIQPSYEQLARRADAFREYALARREYALQARFLRQVCHSPERLLGPNQQHVFPSETFLARAGLHQEIDRLLRRLHTAPSDARALRNLARAYYLRSDWLSLQRVTARIYEREPGNVRAVADMTRALTNLGRLEEALDLLDRHLARDPAPLLKFRRGQVGVIRARGGTVSGYLRAVMEEQRLAAEAIREEPDTAIRRWIRLDLALDNLSIADPLHLHPPAVAEVESLYREYAAIPERGLGVLSRLGLAMGRTLAAYALLVSYERVRSPKAEPLRRSLMQIDPESVLCTRLRSASARTR